MLFFLPARIGDFKKIPTAPAAPAHFLVFIMLCKYNS